MVVDIAAAAMMHKMTTLPIPRTVRDKCPGIEINHYFNIFPGHSTPRGAARLLKHVARLFEYVARQV